MKICVIVLLINILSQAVFSKSDLVIGYQVTLAIPTVYTKGFQGRAFLMETQQNSPKFRTAINVEAVDDDDKYSCSLDVFLGDVRVWSSAHLSRFYTTDKCVLQLTQFGDLRLKGPNDRIGWRSGTSGQGVQRLELLNTGNLVLVDALNLIKWQTFNFPTNIMLWGQRLSSQTRLTSFPVNSTLFYSLEFQDDKVALYLNNLGKWKYSYWEHRPSGKRNITFVQLTSDGLEIFNGNHKFDKIKSTRSGPLRFLSLDSVTGNLRLYHYSDIERKFESSYEAVNFTCDLPLACKSYGICMSSGSCSCIRLVNENGTRFQSDCSGDSNERFCGKGPGEMLELQGVISVLNSVVYKSDVDKQGCADSCADDCKCVAAQYAEGSSSRKCQLYRVARGVKQVERGSNSVVYMVKVPKGTNGTNHGLKKWMIIVIAMVDGFIIFVVLVGLVYYVIRKRIKNSHAAAQPNSTPLE